MQELYPSWSSALAGLSPSQALEVERIARTLELPSRRTFIAQGQQATNMYVFESGRGRAFYTTSSGAEYTAKILHPGSMCGILAVLTGQPPIYSVQTLQASVVREFPRETFLEIVSQNAGLAFGLTKVLAGLSREALGRNTYLLDACPVRLGRVLCDIAQRAGAFSGPAVIEGISHETLATMVGASRTWISQTLGTFEKRGHLSVGRQQIRLHNLPAFRDFIEALPEPAL